MWQEKQSLGKLKHVCKNRYISVCTHRIHLRLQIGVLVTLAKSKKRFSVPLNSQGHMRTEPQHYRLWELSTHSGDSLWLGRKLSNPLGHQEP